MLDGNIEKFFSHENNSYPISYKNADLRSDKKSDLLTRLEEVVSATCETSAVECVILDGAAIVNFLKPIGVATFAYYANDVFRLYIERQPKDSTRIDIVWEKYIPNSLKASIQTKRGTGTRRRVLPDSKISGNWQLFFTFRRKQARTFQLPWGCVHHYPNSMDHYQYHREFNYN